MRVGRKTGHRPPVVHAPAVLAGEVLPDLAPFEQCLRPELRIAARVDVDVMHAEQERIDRVPRHAERMAAKDRGVSHRGSGAGGKPVA
jgi:hypothetical protein